MESVIKKRRRDLLLGIVTCLVLGALAIALTWGLQGIGPSPPEPTPGPRGADPWMGSALAQIQPSEREAIAPSRREDKTLALATPPLRDGEIDAVLSAAGTGSVHGFLFSQDGTRRPGYSLSLANENFRASARSNRDGEFEFEAVPAGEFTLRMKTRSVLFAMTVQDPRQVVVRPGETTFVDLYPGERQIFGEVLLQNEDRQESAGDGVSLRPLTLTPENLEVHPTLRGRIQLRRAAEFRAEVTRLQADEEVALMPERFEERCRELERLQEVFRTTQGSWRPLHLTGLGAGVYTLRLEFGEIELPGGKKERVFHEHRIDLTHGDVRDLKLHIDPQKRIEEAVARARQP